MNQILDLGRPIALPGVEVAMPLVSRIYCGAAKPSGGWVGRDDFQAFLKDVVSSAFPNGYTVLGADGVWKDTDSGELVYETTRVIEIAHGYEELAEVGFVASLYKERFGQQAVMVSTTQAAVSFV